MIITNKYIIFKYILFLKCLYINIEIKEISKNMTPLKNSKLVYIKSYITPIMIDINIYVFLFLNNGKIEYISIGINSGVI